MSFFLLNLFYDIELKTGDIFKFQYEKFLNSISTIWLYTKLFF